MQTLTVTIPAETPGLFRTRVTGLIIGFQSVVSEDSLYDPPAEEGDALFTGPGGALKRIAERASERGWSWTTGDTEDPEERIEAAGFVTTLSVQNVDQIARRINDLHANGLVVTFQGEGVWSQFGPPASSWRNGSLSVNVRGRQARQGVRWAKTGDRVTVSWATSKDTREEVVSGR